MNEQPARPAAGRAGVHVFPVRVYYEDTDAAGIVYYANYLEFAERARTEMLRDFGINHPSLLATDGVAFAVRRCSADYRVPARLDDRLEVRTRVIAVRGASIVLEQAVCRDGEVIVPIEVTLACMTNDGRATRVPARIRAMFEDFHNEFGEGE